MGFPVDINNQQSVELIPKEKLIRKLFHAGDLVIELDTTGYSLCTFTITNLLTPGNSVIVQGSNNGTSYVDVQPVSLGSMASNLSATSGNFFKISNQPTSYQIGKVGRFVKFIFNGSTTNPTLFTAVLSSGQISASLEDIRIPNTNSWSYTSGLTGLTGSASSFVTPTVINPALQYVINSLDIVNSGAIDSVIQLRSFLTSGTASTIVWSQFIKAGERVSLQNITPGIPVLGGRRVEVISSANTTYFINAQGITTNI